ncbi:MAG: glycosyltransferase family 39 protein [Acidobacteriia bacterium]|nr:glycosyltransferase family 39 protein [Terriglobia bacterium]
MAPVFEAVLPGEQHPHSRFASGSALVLYLAGVKLLLHLLTAGRYGIFRDEMYYAACSQHLAWGYVDHPPMSVFIAWFARHVFGDSLLGLRLLPAIAGAALVWMAGQLAREMGGGRFAQALAALAVIPVPIYLILQHWLTMNAFEPLLWMVCLWCVLRAINRDDPRYWFWFGALTGIGLETKYSIAVLVLGVMVGILFSPERRFLKSRWLWSGMLVAAIFALPNFLWQLQHNFPFLELLHNIRMNHRDVVRGPVSFLLDQAAIMNPILFSLWAGGLPWLFFGRAGRRYRPLGWTYVLLLAAFIVFKGKNYYVVPIYPILFAAGAVGFERMTGRSLAWCRTAYVAIIVAVGALLLPIASPILSPENYIRYQRALHIEPPVAERQNNGPLPQYFADEFGWEEMVQQVARVYNSLSPEERPRTAIFCNGWGQAAAIDFFGPRYGLPRAISNHNNYWYWGPRDYTGEIVIVLGSDGSGDRRHFRSVEAAGRVEHPYSRRDEHFTIWLCRGLNQDLRAAWPAVKKFD